MSVETPNNKTLTKEELPKQSKLQECVSEKIPKVREDHPEMESDQQIAVAYSMCRERLGLEKADILRMIEAEGLFDMKLLRLLETGKIFDIKLQTPLIKKIKGDLSKEDLINYGLLLRQEGMDTQETSEHLPYKAGWVKKHINPIFNQVIKNQKDNVEKSQNIPPNIQEIMGQFLILDVKKEQRRFTAYASSEQIDSQGEILGMKGLLKNMHIFMRRGAPVMFSHTNRHVGKAFEWEERNITVNNKSIPAVVLDVEVFQDYIGDDLAWACVLHAKENNLPVLSFGATPTAPPEKICDEVKCVRKYNEIQPYEVSITNVLQGIIGANPGAKIINLGPMTPAEKPQLHPMVGGKLAKAHKDGLLPDDIALLNFALETCDLCKAEYAQMIQKGIPDHKAEQLLLQELKKEMSTNIEEQKDLEKEGVQPPQAQTPPGNPGGGDIPAMFQQIMQALQRLMPSEEEKPVEESATPIIQPENMTKANLTKLIEVEVQKSLAAMKPEDLLMLAKQKGAEVISTPAPSAGAPVTARPDLKKQQEEDKVVELTDEECLTAMSQYNGAEDLTTRIQQRKKL